MKRAVAVFLGLVLAATGVFVFAWLLWWLWHREQEAMRQIEIEVKPPLPGEMPDAECREPSEQQAEVPGTSKGASPARKRERQTAAEDDDLKRIEGVGPKIAGVLRESGITTFSALAGAGVPRLREILEKKDPRLIRLADPATWPEQAALAASGDWQALASLQMELKGGRRA